MPRCNHACASLSSPPPCTAHQALESFVLRCPKDVSPHCEAILQLSLTFLSYDPNFTDDAMDEDDEGGQGDEEEDEE